MEESYCPCSENKGADQLCSYCEADLRLCFHIGIISGFLTARLIWQIGGFQIPLLVLKDLCAVTVYTCLKIYLYKKALLIFVKNVTFFSMLYHGAVEYVANTWICVYMIVK